VYILVLYLIDDIFISPMSNGSIRHNADIGDVDMDSCTSVNAL
jgi:hypothetical protein